MKSGPLVVEDVGVVEGLQLAVLRVAEGRIHDGEEADRGRGGHLRGDEVDAALLPPLGVASGSVQQLAHGIAVRLAVRSCRADGWSQTIGRA